MNKRLVRTIELAQALMPIKSTGRVFHLATIYDGPRLLSIGYNNYKHEHLRHKYGEYKALRGGESNYTPGRHAEIVAANRLKLLKKNLTMCVVRVDRNGKVSLSKPCNNCAKILRSMNFKEIIWSIDNSSYGITE